MNGLKEWLAVAAIIFAAGGAYFVMQRDDGALAQAELTLNAQGNRITRLETQFEIIAKRLETIEGYTRGINEKLDRKS